METSSLTLEAPGGGIHLFGVVDGHTVRWYNLKCLRYMRSFLDLGTIGARCAI
jgi:hypothetical protein